MDIEQRLIAELQNKDWRLVGPDQDPRAWRAFVQAVGDCVARSTRAGKSKRLAYCTTVAYSPVLFEAANDKTNLRRRDRAFIELFNWIYVRLISNYQVPSDSVPALANEILTIIYKQLDRVDRPQGFLSYVSRIVQYKVYEYRRQQGRMQKEELLPGGEEEDDEGSMDSFSDGTVLFSLDELEEAEAELLRRIHECMPKRAVRQKAIIRALVFEGMTYHEIAEEWGTTEGALHTLWHRAKDNLLTHCRDLIREILERHRLTGLLEDIP